MKVEEKEKGNKEGYKNKIEIMRTAEKRKWKERGRNRSRNGEDRKGDTNKGRKLR